MKYKDHGGRVTRFLGETGDGKLYILGVDLGGTLIRAGLFADSGNLLIKQEMLTKVDEGPDAVIARIAGLVRHVCGQAGISMDEGKIRGLGIGSPGPLNPHTGVILSPPNLPGWDCIPLKERLQQDLGLPVYLNNDANAAVLAEYLYGSGKGVRNLVYMTISTGIGGGIILDGRLLLGEDGNAGEIGHMILQPEGPLCGCGSRGCLEALASGTGIVNRTRERLKAEPDRATRLREKETLTAKEVIAAAQAGDPLAADIVKETQVFLGLGIANVINLFNPKKIVFGGGVSKAGEYLLKPAIEIARNHALKGIASSVEFGVTALGEDVGLYGAAALVKYDALLKR